MEKDLKWITINDEKRENRVAPKRKIARPTVDWHRHEEEVRAYFAARAARLKPVKTTRTPHGQILDWIPIDSQHVGSAIARPPELPELQHDHEKPDRPVQFELEHPNAERGPAGTVPILRRDPAQIQFGRSLQDYLSKHGRRSYPMFLNDRDSIEVPGDGAHDYGYTSYWTTCYGGEGYLAAFDPYTQYSDEFSLLQIALTRGSGSSKQTVEAGWQEYRDLYGDWAPHLFVYYTTNGYTSNGDNKGGYNQDVDGWVQYSDTVFPGAISSPNSVRGGAQYVMRIKYQLYQGNWWLSCNNRWIGYYPASLFSSSGLRSQAEKVAFYGEIVDSSDHSGETWTDMGSGYWPDYHWTWAAYLRNLRYQSNTDGAMSAYNGTSFVSDPDRYDVELHMNSGESWGSYFWVGGPGAG